MTEQEYLEEVRRLRYLIEIGTAMDLKKARQGLDELKDIIPWRLEYIYAMTALFLKEGKDKKVCRSIIDSVTQEWYMDSTLPDAFYLRKQSYEKGSAGYKQADFLEGMYKNHVNQKTLDELNAAKQSFILMENNEEEIIGALAQNYYIVRNNIMYFILSMASLYIAGNMLQYSKSIASEVLTQLNIGYLLRVLMDGEQHTFLLIDNEDPCSDFDVLAKALQVMGHEIILLRGAVSVESIDGSVSVSIAKAQERTGNVEIPIAVVGNPLNTNRKELVHFIADTIPQENAMIVFATDQMMECLGGQGYKKNIQRLTRCLPKYFSEYMSFGWAGDYLKYISYIYGMSVSACLAAEDEVELSIVIPARNSPDTLRYTLETCLHQRFSGSYEIVLSDNSDLGYDEIYNLYKELNNEHIRYYRTPMVLGLAKSFEFAFLQARGEFVFAIGADDGVFPWTLEVIHQILPTMRARDYDILKWNRSFYAWPGFNRGQQNQLVMDFYDRDAGIQLEKKDSMVVLKELFSDIKNEIYAVPLSYINSGFRRRYLQRMLKDTGCLWNSFVQDMYMGALNLAINKEFLYTSYPLAVAGMSSRSIGANSVNKENDLYAFGECYVKGADVLSPTGNMGEYVPDSTRTRYQWGFGVDVFEFLYSVARLKGMGYFPDVNDEILSLKKWLPMFISRIGNSRIYYELQIGLLYYGMQSEGIEKNYIQGQYVPRDISNLDMGISEERIYPIGLDFGQKHICLDASLFGIKNIKQAVEFLANLTGL